MFLNFLDTVLNFLFKRLGDRRLLGINPKEKSPTTLERMNQAANRDPYHQDLTHAVIELFLGLYDMWHGLVGITCLYSHLAI